MKEYQTKIASHEQTVFCLNWNNNKSNKKNRISVILRNRIELLYANFALRKDAQKESIGKSR